MSAEEDKAASVKAEALYADPGMSDKEPETELENCLHRFGEDEGDDCDDFAAALIGAPTISLHLHLSLGLLLVHLCIQLPFPATHCAKIVMTLTASTNSIILKSNHLSRWFQPFVCVLQISDLELQRLVCLA